MMRNIIRSILLFVLFFVPAVAKCQTEKKTWLIGGTGYVYVYKLESNLFGWEKYTVKQTKTHLDFNIGYFLFKDFVLGIRANSNSIWTKFKENTITSRQLELSGGPFTRIYLVKNQPNFNLFLEANFQRGVYAAQSVTRSFVNQSIIASGFEYFPNTSVGIEFLIGYKNKYNYRESENFWSSVTNDGIYIGLNFQYHLLK